MYEKIFESEPPKYRMPNEIGAVVLGGLIYNNYLFTPPRIYGEEIFRTVGLFTIPVESLNADRTLCLTVWLTKIRWPGWEIGTFKFDPVTGKYLGYTEELGFAAAGYYTGQVYEGMYGTLWSGLLTHLIQIDPVTMSRIGDPIAPTRFGKIAFWRPIVDLVQDILVDKSESTNGTISVFRFSTGEHLRDIFVNGHPSKICPEDANHVYVLGSTTLEDDASVLSLVDYTTGRIISSTRSPVISGWNYQDVLMSWDPVTRRINFFGPVVNDSTGACTSRIEGYRPVPIPVKLTKAIPLTPPRKGRTIPYISRCVGDVGEAIGGFRMTPTITGDAHVLPGVLVGGGDGYATGRAVCDAEGTANVSLSMEY